MTSTLVASESRTSPVRIGDDATVWSPTLNDDRPDPVGRFIRPAACDGRRLVV